MSPSPSWTQKSESIRTGNRRISLYFFSFFCLLSFLFILLLWSLWMPTKLWYPHLIWSDLIWFILCWAYLLFCVWFLVWVVALVVAFGYCLFYVFGRSSMPCLNLFLLYSIVYVPLYIPFERGIIYSSTIIYLPSFGLYNTIYYYLGRYTTTNIINFDWMSGKCFISLINHHIISLSFMIVVFSNE